MKRSTRDSSKDTSIKTKAAALSGHRTIVPASVPHPLIDSSSRMAAQAKLQESLFGQTAQRQPIDEEELLQGKFATQMQPEEDEELLQGKFGTQAKSSNKTGLPDEVKTKMETTFNTDFSSVRVHANSSRAPEVGALAYTQGHDIHFAPGQFSPDNSMGQQLLGHELTHVVQQQEGHVQPTTEVAGLPVNDNPAFEKEADSMGSKASR